MKSTVVAFSLVLSALTHSDARAVQEGDPEGKKWDPARAIEHLILSQGEDGTWPFRASGARDEAKGASVAVTAISCLALLEYWDSNPEKIRPAVEKGIQACVKHTYRDKKKIGWYDVVYGQLYTLQLLTRLREHPAWKERSKQWRNHTMEILPFLLGLQSPSGMWGYRSCAQTGAVLLVLKDLKEAGIPVPDESMNRGLSALKKLRERASYPYRASDDAKWQLSDEDKTRGSAGRSAVCDWALYRYGQVTGEQFEAMLKGFIDAKGFLWESRNNRTQNLYASDFNGEYAFFAYYYATLALRGMSNEKMREEWTRILKDDLMKSGEQDGTWRYLSWNEGLLDFYSTAAALLSLKHLEQLTSRAKNK